MSKSPSRNVPSASTDLIPEERVHAALRRAAQLQAEAMERLEQRAVARIEAEAGPGDQTGGFRREDVEAAAAGAGISSEYLRQALIEQEQLGDDAKELAPWIGQMADRMLRTRQRTIELSRTIEAPPRAILEAMQRVFPAAPYEMALVDSVGGLPLEGGVLVFHLPELSMLSTTSYTPFSYAAKAVELRQLHVSLRPVQLGAATGCELTLRGDLRTGVRQNVWIGLGLSGVGAGVGALMGTFATLASGGLIPLIAVGAVLGAAGLGGASAAGYGAMYRYYLRKVIHSLETLLRVVDTNARTGGAFRSPHPPVGPGGVDPFAATLNLL